MNIFFTGHNGFLGSELIPHLQSTGHIVYTGNLNLCDKKAVDRFCIVNNIEFIIHAAIKGGRRVAIDTAADFHNNVAMFENLQHLNIPMVNFCSGAAYDKNQNIHELSENDIGLNIPADFYGLAKYVISQRCMYIKHIKNLRFFNVFGPNETEDRFIKTNIRNYINNRNQIIFKDKYMDFFGISDTKKVIDLILQNFNDINIPSCVNLVYTKKYTLSDICNTINTLSSYTVDVDIQTTGWDNAYTGNGTVLNNLNIQLDGIVSEIVRCFNFIRKCN
jgi:nucleoside-diphosphate-sugar epimerase